jgi:copper chaperone
MKKTELTIRGMSCNHCVAKVQKALQAIHTVRVTDVHIGSATLEYDETSVTHEEIKTAIERAGYALAS